MGNPLPPNYDARRDLQIAKSIAEGLVFDLDYLSNRDNESDQFAASLHIRNAEVLESIKRIVSYIESAVARTPVPAVVSGYAPERMAAA